MLKGERLANFPGSEYSLYTLRSPLWCGLGRHLMQYGRRKNFVKLVHRLSEFLRLFFISTGQSSVE